MRPTRRSVRPLAVRLAPAALSALAAVVSSLPAPPVQASLIIAMDTPTMVAEAQHIAVVDVASVSAAWDEKHERIITTVDLAVVEVWKGSMAPAMHVKVMQPGGTVGDIQMTVFGMPHFATGERALVFLRGTTAGAGVVGMSQGKRILRKDVPTGRWMVHAPDQAGASYLRPRATTPAPLPIFDGGLRPLDDLRTEIRGLVDVKKAPVK